MLGGPLISVRSVLSMLGWGVRHPFLLTRLLGVLASDPRHLLRNSAVLPRAFVLARDPEIRKSQHIHSYWFSTSATVGMALSLATGVPYSITAHRWDIVDGNLRRAKLRTAAFVRCISAAGRRQLVQGVAHPVAPVVTIHVGVTLPPPPVAQPVIADRLRIVCPANLIPVKGHRYLITAIAGLVSAGVPCRLDIAGTGELEAELRSLVASLGIADVVTFLGYVDHEDLLTAYQAGEYDVVALASLDLGNGLHEGIPVALMEGMARGLVPVATSTGSIPELISDQVDGLLVPGGDAEALEDALRRIYTSPAERERLSDAARERVARDFSAVRSAEMLEARVAGLGDPRGAVPR